MKPRLYPALAALLALAGGPAAVGQGELKLPAEPASFPAAPGQPHTYILAIESEGVPLTVAKAVEVRDAFLIWAAKTGWKLAPRHTHATMVVRMTLSSKLAAGPYHGRAIIWSDFVNIYTGEEGLLAEETLSPVYIVPVAYLDYPFGYWEFAYSNFYQPGAYYRPFIRHHGHPISPICPPKITPQSRFPSIATWFRRAPAQASALPVSRVIALARDPDASLLNFQKKWWGNPARRLSGGNATGDGAAMDDGRDASGYAGGPAGLKASGSSRSSGGHFWSGWTGRSGGGGYSGGGGRSWGGGGGHFSGGGGGGGGGGGSHASGGSSNQSR